MDRIIFDRGVSYISSDKMCRRYNGRRQTAQHLFLRTHVIRSIYVYVCTDIFYTYKYNLLNITQHSKNSFETLFKNREEFENKNCFNECWNSVFPRTDIFHCFSDFNARTVEFYRRRNVDLKVSKFWHTPLLFANQKTEEQLLHRERKWYRKVLEPGRSNFSSNSIKNS